MGDAEHRGSYRGCLVAKIPGDNDDGIIGGEVNGRGSKGERLSSLGSRDLHGNMGRRGNYLYGHYRRAAGPPAIGDDKRHQSATRNAESMGNLQPLPFLGIAKVPGIGYDGSQLGIG